MPPAAFVSTTARQPADTAVRTPCTTVDGGSPSYRWTRPRNTSTRTGPALTVTHGRHVPGHGGLGKPAQLGQRDLGLGGADRVGGRGPARAEDHRDSRAGRPARSGGRRWPRRRRTDRRSRGHHGAWRPGQCWKCLAYRRVERRPSQPSGPISRRSPARESARPQSRRSWDDPRMPWTGQPARVDILLWAAIVLSGIYYWALLPFVAPTGRHAPGPARAAEREHGIDHRGGGVRPGRARHPGRGPARRRSRTDEVRRDLLVGRPAVG